MTKENAVFLFISECSLSYVKNRSPPLTPPIEGEDRNTHVLPCRPVFLLVDINQLCLISALSSMLENSFEWLFFCLYG